MEVSGHSQAYLHLRADGDEVHMGLQRFDKIAGNHAAIVSAMIKLDALAHDYLRPGE